MNPYALDPNDPLLNVSDVSTVIGSLFNYNRKRFRHEEEDDDLKDMEVNNYNLLLKEEQKSSKIAKKEELLLEKLERKFNFK
jgi:hypothetical protein